MTAFVNVKPLERTQVYETERQAIQHMFLHRVTWNFGGAPFGRTIDTRRAINAAVKARDFSAFRATPRRGYWRIEIANGRQE